MMIDSLAVALTVCALDKVARFYTTIIGLSVLDTASDRVVLGAGGTALLELLHRPGASQTDASQAGLFHTAFLLPSRTDLAQWLAHAAAKGQVLDGAADHLVSEAVYLHDPEGNGVEIYADRRASLWTWNTTAAGRRIAMGNARLDRAGLLALATQPWAGAPPGTRIGHVHLQVGDTAVATDFYAGRLGLDVTNAWAEAVFLSSGGYHHQLAVNTWNSGGSGPRDPGRAGLAHVTLFASGPDAAPDATSELVDPWGTVFRIQPTSKDLVSA